MAARCLGCGATAVPGNPLECPRCGGHRFFLSRSPLPPAASPQGDVELPRLLAALEASEGDGWAPLPLPVAASDLTAAVKALERGSYEIDLGALFETGPVKRDERGVYELDLTGIFANRK